MGWFYSVPNLFNCRYLGLCGVRSGMDLLVASKKNVKTNLQPIFPINGYSPSTRGGTELATGRYFLNCECASVKQWPK